MHLLAGASNICQTARVVTCHQIVTMTRCQLQQSESTALEGRQCAGSQAVIPNQQVAPSEQARSKRASSHINTAISCRSSDIARRCRDCDDHPRRMQCPGSQKRIAPVANELLEQIGGGDALPITTTQMSKYTSNCLESLGPAVRKGERDLFHESVRKLDRRSIQMWIQQTC